MRVKVSYQHINTYYYDYYKLYIYIYRKGDLHSMKIICSKSQLIQGINIALKAVPAKSTMAILECILIDASGSEIKLTANDMELGIETVVDGDILEKGIVAVDAKIFSEIIRKLPENEVVIETDENYKTTITCEKAKFTIVSRSGEDFSYLPEVEKKDYISISQFTLKEVIRQTIFSIAQTDNIKILTGELFEINGDQLRVVSLDKFRISIRKIRLKESYENHKVIVPGKTLSDLGKILSGEMDSEVKLFFTKNHIVFEFDKTTMVSRLIEGEYYNVDKMLSKDYETKIRINKRELLDSIDRSTLLSRDGDKKPIVMELDDNGMEIRMNSTFGSMKENIDIEKDGKDMMIGFDPKFIMDALRVIDDENITVYFLNPNAPCFIKNDEETYIYIILPCKY